MRTLIAALVFAFIAMAAPKTAFSTETNFIKAVTASVIPSAIADEGVPSPAPSMIVPVEQSQGDKIGGAIEKIADSIPLEGAIMMMLLFVYDIVRRKWPTKNPASLLRDVQKVLRGFVKLFSKLDLFIDRIVGGQGVAK